MHPEVTHLYNKCQSAKASRIHIYKSCLSLSHLISFRLVLNPIFALFGFVIFKKL